MKVDYHRTEETVVAYVGGQAFARLTYHDPAPGDPRGRAVDVHILGPSSTDDVWVRGVDAHLPEARRRFEGDDDPHTQALAYVGNVAPAWIAAIEALNAAGRAWMKASRGDAS